jgi:hypothetical protein
MVIMPMASEDEANFGGWIYSNALEIVQRFGAPGYWIDTGIYREPLPPPMWITRLSPNPGPNTEISSSSAAGCIFFFCCILCFKQFG